MALRVPNIGERNLLARILTNAGGLRMRLFTNDASIDEETVFDNSLTEVSNSVFESGDYPITLSQTVGTGGWEISTDSGITQASHQQIDFKFIGQATIYGYFVTPAGNNDILWVEKFTDAPYSIPNGGGSIKITPRIQLD